MYLEDPATPDKHVYENIIDVLSPLVIFESDPVNFWVGEDELRTMAARLLTTSISWIINDIDSGTGPIDKEQHTFNYTFGGEQRYERGYLLAQDCEQLVIRSLRGWIRVFPTSTQDCPAIRSDHEAGATHHHAGGH